MKVDEDLQHQIMQHSNSSASASASQLLPSLNFDDDNDLGFQNLAGMGDDCDDLPDVFWDYGDVSSNDVNVRNMEYSTEGSGAGANNTTNIIPSPSPPSTATTATTATNTNTNTTGTIQPQPQAQPATLDKNNSNPENRTTSTTAPQAQLPPPQQQQQLQNNIRGFQNSNVDVGGLGNSPYLNAAAAAGVGVGGVGFPQLSGNLGNLGSFPFLLPPPPGPGQALDNNVNVNGAGSLSLASSLQQAQQQAQQQQQQAQQQQQNSQLLNVLPRAPNSAGAQSVSSNTPNTAAQVLQNQLFGMSAAQGALNPLVYQSIQQQQAQAQAQQPSNNQQQQQQQAANLQFLQQQLQGQQALLPPHLFIQQSSAASVSGGNNNQNQNQNTGMLPPQGIQTAQHQSLRPLPPPQSKLNVNANSQSTNSQQQQQQQTYQSQMLPLASAPQGGRNQNQPQQSQGQGQSSNTGITQASMSMPKPIPKRTAQHLQLTDRGKTPDTNNDKPSTISTATATTMPSPRQQNVKANIVSSSDTDGEHQRSLSQSAATSTSTSTSIKKSRRSPPTSVEISTNSSISQKLYMPSSISSYIDLDGDIDASEQDHNGLMEVNNMLPGDGGGPGQLKHAQHAHAADEQMTEAERALANRKRNREHARNTRARKKAYLESLKSTLDELCRERDSLYSERAGAASLLLEVQKTRTDVLLSFFALRSSYEKRRQLWSSILDENVNCVMPVTPYRSFPASEVQISKCQRTIMGVDSMIADAASMHVLLHSLVDRSRFPNGKVEFRYTLVAEEAVVSGNQMMARWSMSTTNAIKLGGKKEVKKMGMLCAKFNSAHKIVSLELMFDVMAFMLQLKQSVGANAFTVIPNTVQTCTGSFGKTPMVLTLADRPYTIVQVNEEWEKMTGRKAEDVVGKESCKILQGAQTESSAIGEQMASICFQRPVFTVLTNYAADGRKFRNFISLYPLSTDSKITHYLGLTLHLEWLDEKDKKKEEEKKEKAPESSSSVAATTTAAASTTAVTTKTTKIIKTEGKETGE